MVVRCYFPSDHLDNDKKDDNLCLLSYNAALLKGWTLDISLSKIHVQFQNKKIGSHGKNTKWEPRLVSPSIKNKEQLLQNNSCSLRDHNF